MSDNLRELGSDQVVGNGTSQGEATPIDDEANRQPAKVDLSKLPEFQAYQSNVDRRIATIEARARADVQAATDRAIRLEQQVHNVNMRGMDEQQQLAYQNQLLQDQIREINRQRELDIMAIQRQRDLEEIVASTGIPWEGLEGVNNIHEAWRRGNQFQKQQAEARSLIEQNPVDDRVDVAAARPSGATSRMQQEYDSLKKAYEFDKLVDLMAEASRKGITLNEW